MSYRFYPSLAAAPYAHMQGLAQLLEPHVGGLHVDIGDTHFVPTRMLSFSDIALLQEKIRIPVWVHLMVLDPVAAYEKLILKPGDWVSVHAESASASDLKQLFLRMKTENIRPSLVLNPTTPISFSKQFIRYIEQLLLMGVFPGYSGQDFLPLTFKRIHQAKQLIEGHPCTLGVDGGFSAHNLDALISLGVQDIVVGSALFKE